MNFQPFGDRVVVQPGESESVTPTGIILPEAAQDDKQEGTVVAVGPGRTENGHKIGMEVAVGDVVIYSKYGGTQIKNAGIEYLVLSERDILGRVK